MKYSLVCDLDGDFALYQKKLVLEVAEKFGVMLPLKQRFEPHFTLKYGFETEKINEIETLIESFCAEHSKTPVETDGPGSFRRDVVFIRIKLSDEARRVFLELMKELRKISWLSWRDIEGDNLTFHSTLAADCEINFDEIYAYVGKRKEHFDCRFDNITILRECGIVDEVMTWETYKKFRMD